MFGQMAKLTMLIALVLLLGLGATDASAKDKKPGQDDQFDAHAAHTRTYFHDDEMDFAFTLILGATMNHGCEVGEAFYTAGQIKEGDSASWQDAWIKTAERVEARGLSALASGHQVSASEQLRRASYYYRAALISMNPTDPRFKELGQKSRNLLIQAGKLMNPPLEYIEIPFEGTVLPGYFRKADCGPGPQKTLLMVGGGETFVEDLVFYISGQAHARCYNFLAVDIPGQGLLPLEGKFFRYDAEAPLKAVIDYAMSRPEVDPKRLAAYGISGGGYFVPRTAQFDKRLKAIAMNSAVVDDYRLFADTPMAKATPEVVATWSTFKRGTMEAIAWRWGVPMDNIPGLVEANKGYVYDPAKVSCPALSLVGEGEYQSEEVQRQQADFLAKSASKVKKLAITPANEGASNHCLTENRSVMSQVVFDFFDQAFDQAKPATK